MRQSFQKEFTMSAIDFKQEIQAGYTCEGPSITLGGTLVGNMVGRDMPITIPLRSLNRHGLIAGATGTGKTKTIQLASELLSKQGIPTLLMDLKGDLSGLAAAGELTEKIEKRQQKMGIDFEPTAFPVEFMSISDEAGVRLRATISDFGPVLLSKILGLNSTQSSVISVLFKYSADNNLPLIDLEDLKKVLNYMSNEGKEEVSAEYGRLSSMTTSAILRKIIELDEQGADQFFGEPSFDVNDFLKTDEKGNGVINILRLTDMQNKPKLFSTFMLNLLNQIYNNLPEVGDLPKPKFIVFIDEAHLIFNQAPRELLEKIETIVKLIRSKSVGVIFCTQNPTDIPASVLSQLGLKVQHALRAFTAKDRKAIKLAAENYPPSEYYNPSEMLTALGIGEAAVTALNEKGHPTPLVTVLLQAPRSRMGILSETELAQVVNKSTLATKYAKKLNRESAKNILSKKIKSKPADKESVRSAKKQKSFFQSRLFIQTIQTLIREFSRAFLRKR